jgi:hypothetical protein
MPITRFLTGTIISTRKYAANDFESMVPGTVTHITGSISVGNAHLLDDRAVFNQR